MRIKEMELFREKPALRPSNPKNRNSGCYSLSEFWHDREWEELDKSIRRRKKRDFLWAVWRKT
jgi:hypothetical protein